MPFYISLAKIISNQRALKTFVTTLLPTFSKNFFKIFLPDTNELKNQVAFE